MLKKYSLKIKEVSITVFTLAALAAINYSIFNSSFVFIAIAVLLVHELGHYFSAKRFTKKVKLPFFIPLPFLAIGITYAQGLTSKQKAKVAIWGPIAGLLAALAFIFANNFLSFMTFGPLIFLAVGEIVFNYFGSDGIKYRKYKKEQRLCI